MKVNTYLFGLLVLIFSQSIRSENDKSNYGNFDKHKPVLKTIIEKSKTPDRADTVQSCYVYDDIAVTETTEHDTMGPLELTIRPITDKNINKICSPQYKGVSYKIPTGFNYAGKYGKFILLQYPDSFGLYRSIEIYRLSKNAPEMILKGEANQFDRRKKNLTFFQTDSGAVGLDYWMGLNLTCKPADFSNELFHNNQDCWSELLKKNKFKETSEKITCSNTKKKLKFDVQQVLLHVKIPDLNHPDTKEILSNQAECAESP